MDLVQLSYFEAIARGGSFTKAARQLGVSQPTLTVAIQNLERDLGTRLFHRDRQGIRLTATGQELLEQTRGLFGQLEAIEDRIRGLESEEVGRFVIGLVGVLNALAATLLLTPRVDAHPLDVPVSTD